MSRSTRSTSGNAGEPEGAEGCPAAATTDGVTLSVPASARTGPVSHAIFRVARLHRMIAGQLLRAVGLHPGQELVMMQLWELGPQRQADLVRLLDSDAATMTRTIQRLEHAGFVRRSPCPDDRRAVLVEPTAASRALRHEVERVWTRLEEGATGDLTAEEREAALRALGRLEENLARTVAGGEVAGGGR
ncbi:MarR family winged helix-turn-helix transcriptional regulator [Streptomyces huiliensis]|uniref:MarR family winged helix-turn-helix transcriptional regulator n=1 Tax=Streptomyces huiliensis TaxID=2876027 RepID=UPI001CBD98B4|nr:MarR family winged helix-turn-helix transcriptional regulator [Streptomyces huiliensis]MBZ4321334.1 MarR family winged helix-turn-helix transcriptional regulator [Streptomyces huiliensis]